ncbi:hypothetical protein [Sulfurimonas sp.]|uniref:hypothetical protein n=2 Tax=Sulfurimonas sp. TaxID=2022749 RepID=UPI003D099EDC
MNRSTFALFVALLIHLVLLMFFWLLATYTPELKQTKHPQEKKIKISLKELPKKYKDSGLTKEKIPEPKMAPPMPKGSQLEKIVQQQVKLNPQQPMKTPTLNQPKKVEQKVEKKTPKTEPIPPNKPYIPLLAKEDVNKTKEIKKETQKDPLAWMHEDKSTNEIKQKKKTYANGGNLSQNIQELYGEEFGKLSPGQQQYILDNQEIMRRITQQVLNRVARVNLPRDLQVNKYNVVEFYLHPNGDISDFKFLTKSGIYVLDDTTKETIEYAYSKYPRPKEKTLIRYNVYYHLANY